MSELTDLPPTPLDVSILNDIEAIKQLKAGYSEMMRDPMDVMRRIYDWAGDELTAQTEARLQKWLAAHPQNRYGLNAYTLDEYGLAVDMLKAPFAEYLETFNIELEAEP